MNTIYPFNVASISMQMALRCAYQFLHVVYASFAPFLSKGSMQMEMRGDNVSICRTQ